MNETPLVSVFMLAYNHENFIAQTIDSILIQKTKFTFEIVVGEDCSIDRTKDIILNYACKNPGYFKLVLHKKNVGVIVNQMAVLEACTGKYIAICEGDDYWTDPCKLQKQVDFLESHPQYSITSHRYKIIDEENKKLSLDFAHELFTDNIEGLNYDINSFLDKQYTQTVTVVFRRNTLDLSKLKRYKYSGDILLFYHILKNGLGYCFNFDAAVYRKHSGGIYSKKDESHKYRHGYYIFRNWYNVSKDDVFKQKYFIHKDLVYNDIIHSILQKKKREHKFMDLITIVNDDYTISGFKTALCTIRNILVTYWKGLKS
jgi:glycosyltransferase involved in cell wall biosynthesis